MLEHDVPTVVEGDFEWDFAKEESNLAKHGVSFPEAATVFADRFAVYLDDLSSERTAAISDGLGISRPAIGASRREALRRRS